jgi:hypothetical protein
VIEIKGHAAAALWIVVSGEIGKMAEEVRVAVQSKAEEVYLLLRTRLVAAQNLLRSVRQDHAEQCRLIRLGTGGDLDGIVRRMREIERKILAMQRLLIYAETRLTETQLEGSALEDRRPKAPIDIRGKAEFTMEVVA